jgi:hypothetical protein
VRSGLWTPIELPSSDSAMRQVELVKLFVSGHGTGRMARFETRIVKKAANTKGAIYCLSELKFSLPAMETRTDINQWIGGHSTARLIGTGLSDALPFLSDF